MRFIYWPLLVSVFFLVCAAGRQTTLQPGPALTKLAIEGDSTFRDLRFVQMRRGDKMEYSFPQFKTRQEWEAYRDQLVRHILVANGLVPMPDKCELRPHRFDKTAHADYSVEKVSFESYPGFFVTGNLYMPVGKSAPFPAILNPHGHWKNGRLEDTELNSGPGRCINLARQGYVVLNYDMVGYQDSKQVPHTFAGTPKHQLWGISLMGLQLWDSIRAIDYLLSLPEVDASRLACTGESGGGTQTFMITAIDSRIKVAAPVNMVSAHFQGGCLCENAPALRLNTFNVEIAALTAPRPLLMVSTTGDWTKNNPQVEYPMIRSVYELYNAVDRLHCVQFNYPHNYNKDSREAVYAWFGRWLLGQPDATRLRETEFKAEPKEKLRLFTDEEKAPGDMTEEKLTALLQDHARLAMKNAWPKSEADVAGFRKTWFPVFQDVLAVKNVDGVEQQIIREQKAGAITITGLMLSGKGEQHWIPATLWLPQKVRGAALIVHPGGKHMIAAEQMELVKQLVKKGQAVLAIDVFNSGEHTSATLVRDPALRYFTTFNRTDAQERIQDIVTAAAFLRNYPSLRLYGLQEAGAWSLLAAAVCDDVDELAIDGMNGTINSETFLLQNAFMPGLARYGGLQMAANLFAPRSMQLFNTPPGDLAESLKAAYALKSTNSLKIEASELCK
jgi:dienelactone hydrolase